MKNAPKALEARLRPFGEGVARFHSLLGVEPRFLRPHALPAGLRYDAAGPEALLAALERWPRARRPEALAWRGRLLRLLDRRGEALELLDASLALREDARARAWRGELLADADESVAEGLRELEAAGRASGGHWPWIWLASARLRTTADDAVFAALRAALRARPRDVAALLLRAEAHRRNDALTAGLADARRAAALEPDCVAAHLLVGDFEADLGRRAAALRTFRRASRLDPDVKNRYAKLLPGGSLTGLDAHLAENPDDAWAYALRGDSLRGPGLDGDEPGMADLARAAALDARTPWVRACLARSRVQYKYPREGIADMTAALALDPSCAWLNSWMGECYRRVKDPVRAAKYLRRAIALDPRFAQAHLWLGRVHCDEGRWAEGAEEFTRALELDRAYGLAYAKRGDALARLGRHAAAVSDFDRALNFQVPYGGEWIVDLRSRSRMLLGDYAGACDDLAKVARRKPRIAWVRLPFFGGAAAPAASAEALGALEKGLAQYNRAPWLWGWKGAVLLGAGRGDDGLEALRRCLELDGSFAWAYAWRGRALWLAGEPGAEADFARALALDVSCPWLWSWRAELRLREDRVQEALEDAQRALAVSAMDAHANYCRGEALRRLGKPGEARRCLDKAVEFDPRSASVFISRGLALSALGDHAGQLRDFRRAAELAPDLFRRSLGARADEVLRALQAASDRP